MGYTNYWTFKRPLTEGEYSDLYEFIMWDIYETALEEGVELDLKWGSDHFSYIKFNGIGKDAHEDMFFEFERDGRFVNEFCFCKTNGKPYDKYVWATLEYLKKVMGSDIVISRDI